MKSRSLNLIILVAVLIVSALVARYRHRAPTLQADLETSLDRFWNDSRSEVEITPSGKARIRLRIPAGTRPRQQRWTFPVARWVAARHPEAHVSDWSVLDLTGGWELLETPSLDSPSSKDRAQAVPAFQDPNYLEAARSELLQKQGQSQLDHRMGAGRALLLVDVQIQAVSWLPRLGSTPKQAYGRRARLEHDSSVSLRAQDSAEVRRDPGNRVNKIEACLVLSSQADAEPAQKLLNLGLDTARGDRLRIIVL